jgi:adenylate kinase
MIVFFGPVGAGKSVQGTMLGERFGWEWISTGNIFAVVQILLFRQS